MWLHIRSFLAAQKLYMDTIMIKLPDRDADSYLGGHFGPKKKIRPPPLPCINAPSACAPRPVASSSDTPPLL